jgi:hypothetical protein
MRKILSCICLLAVGAWFTACDDDDDNKEPTVVNEFSLGDQKYALSAGYYDSVKTQTVGADTYHFWNLVVTSSGLTYDDGFSGTGDAVRFDLYTKQSGELPDGTYTGTSVDNGIESARIFTGFTLPGGTGTVYADEIQNAEVTILKSGSTHTITFSATLSDAREVKGTFKGTLTEVSDF